MRRVNRGRVGAMLLALIALILLSGAGPTSAQEPVYTLNWWTVDGGGHTYSTGGSYALGGTIGQPDAGVMGAGSFVLQGGFWPAGEAARFRIFLPLVYRNI